MTQHILNVPSLAEGSPLKTMTAHRGRNSLKHILTTFREAFITAHNGGGALQRLIVQIMKRDYSIFIVLYLPIYSIYAIFRVLINNNRMPCIVGRV